MAYAGDIAQLISDKAGVEPCSVREVMELLKRFGLIAPCAMDRHNRDTRIYNLRASMSEIDIAATFDMTPRRVRQIVREQTRILQSR